MSLYTPEQIDQFREVVRRVLIFNQRISALRLTEMLKSGENPINIGYDLVLKLKKEVQEEKAKRYLTETKEEVISHIEDTVEWVNNQLRAIAQEEKLVYTKVPKAGEKGTSMETKIFAQQNRIAALKAIVDHYKILTGLKMDLGILDKALGTIGVNIHTKDLLNALAELKEQEQKGNIVIHEHEIPKGLESSTTT